MLHERLVTGKAVVIGAGTMGGGIAAQLANVGWRVDLLDLPGPDSQERKTRNWAAAAGLERVRINRPPLLFLPEYAERIRIGNTADDLECLRDADWVVEAVAEEMATKRAVLAQVEAHAGPQTVVSSNTSGLSLAGMTAERSLDFRARFLGTHFLNPPRYLKLLEVIPLAETEPAVTEGFVRFAEQVLGHRCVRARDTPGFISTRIWIQHLLDTIHLAVEEGLTVEMVDALTGPLLGRPKSATFRMADLVGLDIIAAVARNQRENLPEDAYDKHLEVPEVVKRLIAAERVGSKSGAGFYKREGDTTLALDLGTLEYRPVTPVAIPEIEARLRSPLAERLHLLKSSASETAWGRFLRQLFGRLHGFLAATAPQIAEDVLSVDRVMQWGFGWELGPFAMADLLRVEGADTPALPRSYAGEGVERRYRVFGQETLQPMPVEPEYIVLAGLKASGKTVLDAPEASLVDLDDGVVCLEFHTKMNIFDPALCDLVTAARERAEREFAGMVIGCQSPHFSAGFNLNLLVEAMEREDWTAIDGMLRQLQAAFMGVKHARVPIIAAPHGYTLGAGCEISLHCAAIQAAPELQIGLPELHIGLVPAGGGIKELLARAMADWDGASDPFPRVERVFDLLAYPKNSNNAYEARKMGYLRAGDAISRNADRQLYEAKQKVLALANAGYAPPVEESIWVMGEEALARLRLRIHERFRAGLFTEHDRKVADRYAWILSGGGLPAGQAVSEWYLLRLEREGLIALGHERPAQERIRHLLATGKPLKN